MSATKGAEGAAEVTVRRATAQDAETLVAFNAALAQETEGRRLDPERLRQGVRALLARPERGFYVVAEARGKVVGCLMITFEWSDWRNGDFWWIQSVYVLPGWRGRGVYRALHSHIRAEALRRPDVCGLRVYVDRDNHRARRTYIRMGMCPARYDMLEEDFVLGPGTPTTGREEGHA